MKKTLLFATTFLALSSYLFSQKQLDKCGTMEYLQQMKDANPNLEKEMKDYEQLMQTYIAQNQNSITGQAITIPVVVHIVYSADSQNISDQRIIDQIAVSNRDFAGLNPHSMGPFSSSMKANTGIQFCLAKRDPNGKPTTGITRTKTTVDYFVQDNQVKYSLNGGVDAWDTKKYFNIWVCNYVVTDGTYRFSAFSQFPGAGLNETYGIVIRYGAMGPWDSLDYRGNGGILNHELGHSFNLYHIWGDDGTSCSGSDYCDDTPNSAGRSTGKPTGVLTDNCTTTAPGIMYMNFMDYVDDIIYANFTPKQVARIQANFVSPGGKLIPLSVSDVCSPWNTGIVSPEISSFKLFPNPANEQVTVQFRNESGVFVKITLFDIYGRVIDEENVNSSAVENNVVFDTKMLSKGIYMVRLAVNGKNSITQKLIVN